MKALTKLAIAISCAVAFGTFVAEWAAQLAETERETIERHETLLGDR